MSTIKIEVEDSKVEIVLNIIKNLKGDIVSKYEVVSDDTEQKDFIRLSQKPFKKIWDNTEDNAYDKFLKA